MKVRFVLLGTMMVLSCLKLSAQSDEMAFVDGGTYMPFYNFSEDSVAIEPFYIGKYPVTNAEFLDFVTHNPEWRRSKVKKVFAEDGYLKHWASDLELGSNAEMIKNS